MTIPDSMIRLDYYTGSDGPRIMLFGPPAAEFQALRELFLRLSCQSGMQCQLEQEPFVAALADVQLTMINVEQGRPLRAVRWQPTPSFEWKQSSEGWEIAAELTATLIGEPIAGHQYLTQTPGDDAIVVVSRGEYGDEV